MAAYQWAYAEWEAENQAHNEAFIEWDLNPVETVFEHPSMTIFKEEIAPISLCEYAVFNYSDYNGMMKGIDWQATDILLTRAKIDVRPQDFKDFRSILAGYVEWIQEKQLSGINQD